MHRTVARAHTHIDMRERDGEPESQRAREPERKKERTNEDRPNDRTTDRPNEQLALYDHVGALPPGTLAAFMIGTFLMTIMSSSARPPQSGKAGIMRLKMKREICIVKSSIIV